MSPLLQGAMIGLAIAAPVGPIGLLCIRRSLNDGRLAGFVSGLGAASADAVYGIVAVSGVTAITSVLLEYRLVLQLLGAVFLVYLGVTTIRTPQVDPSGEKLGSPSLLAAYGSTFGLTLANPATILSFIGIFAGLGLGTQNGSGFSAALFLVAGVFVGSACWWLILSGAASWLGARVSRQGLRWINVVAGGVMIGLAVWQLTRVLIERF